MTVTELTNKLILYKAPYKIFLKIRKGSYGTNMSKQTDTTMAHIYLMIKKFESFGLVSTRRFGRTRYISLTVKGKEVQDLLKKIVEVKYLK